MTINLTQMTIQNNSGEKLIQYQDWPQFFHDAVHYIFGVMESEKAEEELVAV